MADLILLLHFCFIIVVIFGGFFVYIKPRLAWLHIPMIFWAAFVNLTGRICPLTPLENYFRLLEGQAGYETGFVTHYLSPLVYPEFKDYQLGLILGVSVLVWNLLVYVLIVKKIRKQKK